MPFAPMLLHLTETPSSAWLNKQTAAPHFITIKGNFIYQMSISISFRAQSAYMKYECIGGKQAPKKFNP